MLKISLLLLFCLLPLSNEMPVENFQAYLRHHLEPFTNETLFFARNDSDLIYLNLAVTHLPFPIEKRIVPTYDKRHVTVSIKTQDVKWLALCKQKGTDGLRMDRFRAGNHLFSVDIHCHPVFGDAVIIYGKPSDDSWIWHYVKYIILIWILVFLIGFFYRYKTDILHFQRNVQRYAYDNFSLISHQ